MLQHFQVTGVNLLEKVKRRLTNEEQLYQLGILLGNLALPGKIRTGFLESLATVQRNGHCLRLRLILEDPQFLILPWEYLCQRRGSGTDAWTTRSRSPWE